MPELGEQVYCPEQISIPATFPFLLKQYAKAAIRSQPTDLLKWSTAYFRCLSLNIPPPVKPRLEYPIAKDYCGITPGWLKALLHQLQGSKTLPFKVLWDRWTGACLHHKTLIQILCLGNFDNPNSIPWFKFLGLCTAHLTEDLTHTMILICEILTEEPEGASAMIPLDVFLDLYVFLARIDASKAQTLANIHFTDSMINHWREKDGEIDQLEDNSSSEKRNNVSDASSLEKSDYCLDIPELSEGKNIEEPQETSNREQKEFSKEKIPEPTKVTSKSSTTSDEKELPQSQASEEKQEETEATEEIMNERTEEKLPSSIQEVDTTNKEPVPLDIQNDMNDDSAYLKVNSRKSEEDAGSIDTSKTSDVKLKNSEDGAAVDPEKKVEGSVTDQTFEKKEARNHRDQVPYEEIYMPAVPGIGPSVPEELIQAVCEYMEKVAATQRGMVMPRNITNHNCPPLEVLDY